MDKNDRVISLAKCTAQIGSDDIIAGMRMDLEITDAFQMLFQDVRDEEFLKKVCGQLEDDMVEDVTGLGRAVVEVMENETAGRLGNNPLTLEIIMYLTEENHVILDTSDNVAEVYKEEDAVKVRYMIEGIRKAYEHHYGVSTRFLWERYIDFAFSNPEGFAEIFEASEEDQTC